MQELKTEEYHLIPISSNRFEIIVHSFYFQKDDARKISGCYFSGKQQSWVMPQTSESLKQFLKLFSAKSKDIGREEFLELARKKAIKDYCEQLILKRYSNSTFLIYKDKIVRFLAYYDKKDPTEISEDDIKEYMLMLLETKKISYSYQKQVISAIKFYYEKVLRREAKKYFFEMPRKRKQTLPVVLTKKELIFFFNQLNSIKKLAIFKTIYSSGLRLSELVNLKISDLDSEMMLINVRGGKGMKDRVTILSDDLLILLRIYYKKYRPKIWMFEATEGKQYSSRAIQKMFHQAFDKTRISKHATVHTLRHTFATHLLENGEDVRRIQKLLGHNNLKTTEIYTHITTEAIRNINSPLDNLLKNKENEDEKV